MFATQASPPQAAVAARSSRSVSTAAAGGTSAFATIAKAPEEGLPGRTYTAKSGNSFPPS